MYVNAQNELDQKVLLSSKTITITELIRSIEMQTDYRFSFDPDALPMKDKISVSTDLSVKYWLDIIDKEKGINHLLEGKIIILKRNPKFNHSKSITIYGYIRDGLSGESLIGATVFDKVSMAGTTSNTFGYYSITVPTGRPLDLSFSYVGFLAENVSMVPTVDTLVNVNLQSQILNEVIIVDSGIEPNHTRVQMSAIEVPISQIKSTPALLGEVDVLKVLQLMPGVQSGVEGTSGMYVRGGSPDQNLILLDGVPVYNVSHLFGFFSIFNADAINHVELIKGGFPARYGGRLSSVLDITMKEGNQKEFAGEASLGIVSSKVTLEGPIIKDKSSFIISARRSFADLIAGPLVRRQNENDDIGFYFYDLNAKVNYRFSDKNRIYLSAYMGQDEFSWNRRYPFEIQGRPLSTERGYTIDWGNLISTLRWNHVFNPKLFSNTSLTYSNYNFNSSTTSVNFNIAEDRGLARKETLNRFTSAIEDFAGRYDIEYLPNPNHTLRAGVHLIRHTFTPGAYTLRFTDSIDTIVGTPNMYGWESQLYVEDEMNIGKQFRMNAGLHYSTFHVRGTDYSSLQPRLAGRYLINEKISIKGSFATMAQFIHLLTSSGLGLPNDLWVPTTDVVKPQRSWQGALGAAYEIKKGLDFTVEGYYKEMFNVIEFREGADFFQPIRDWEDKVEAGRGWSYGVEFLLHKKEGKLNGWIGYTLAWAQRQFDDINFGEKFPFRYDIRNDLSVVANYRFSDRLSVGSTVVWRTGTSFTMPIASYFMELNPGFPIQIDHYGGRNQYRLGDYHRMDLNLTWSKPKKWGERAWIFSVYNVYDRRNPFFIFSDNLPPVEGPNGLELGDRYFGQFTLFPILPSVNYQVKF